MPRIVSEVAWRSRYAPRSCGALHRRAKRRRSVGTTSAAAFYWLAVLSSRRCLSGDKLGRGQPVVAAGRPQHRVVESKRYICRDTVHIGGIEKMFSDDAPLLNSCCMLGHRWLHPSTLTFSALAKFRLPSIFLQKRAAAKGELSNRCRAHRAPHRRQRRQAAGAAGLAGGVFNALLTESRTAYCVDVFSAYGLLLQNIGAKLLQNIGGNA